jgi:2-oxoisovalerate dehydrogenase E1 component
MDIDLPELGALNIFDMLSPDQIIEDYRIAYRSRQMSLIGRQEVLNGRAKFGVFGDGKEIPQLALARAFRKGDFRSGYYRDQTIMMALGELTISGFFAQMYAHTDITADRSSGGRLMNGHFSTRNINEDGSWRDLTEQYNSSADMSPTAAQMPRLVGLAQASQMYREIDELKQIKGFSNNGNEVAFGTIGNASCAEGLFWETINAIGVLGVPAVISIWDDGYGISVPNKHQILNEDLSSVLRGFSRQREGDKGFDIYTVHGWDYAGLVMAYDQASRIARQDHVPAIIHVIELTQPQGHSTSGSHERYKSAERLAWEAERDCLMIMREWMIAESILTANELEALEAEELQFVREEVKSAWKAFVESVDQDRLTVRTLLQEIAGQSNQEQAILQATKQMMQVRYPKRKDILQTIFEVLRVTFGETIPARDRLLAWRDAKVSEYQTLYSSHLYSETEQSPLNVRAVEPTYSDSSPTLNGFEILNRYFHQAFERDVRLVTMGEDTGFLGDVNQAMMGMQAKFGEMRVADTGIREATIMGQAIGLALRGLRPIAEIQYLDYILYALQILSDDVASLRWRTVNGQSVPMIVRTRGHRLEGVWHAGSPMAGIINLVRGIHVLVPRDMTRAVGFYNTVLKGDDPAIIVEVLNGYRKKERLPDNLADLQTPLGVPEILRSGRDVTLVTYGATCAIALEASEKLAQVGVDVEVIDVQSLLPFDRHGMIVESLKKTNRLICVDEDVPGGATAYMLQQILEVQGGYYWLDSMPVTLSAKAHRPAYGTDGDYFSKPNRETIFEAVYEMMNEANPTAYPFFYKRSVS